MKQNKNFTIEEDLVIRLRQEDNASALIERLLREHYSINKEMTLEEKKEYLKNLTTEDPYKVEVKQKLSESIVQELEERERSEEEQKAYEIQKTNAKKARFEKVRDALKEKNISNEELIIGTILNLKEIIKKIDPEGKNKLGISDLLFYKENISNENHSE